MDELGNLESEWLSLRDTYASGPQSGILPQAIEAGEAYVAALRQKGQPVPAKVADDLALLIELSS